ncbi:unnamed protein product [Heterobilharzia americana]|nr:unnamed protein product [Heterobilharzia americana]
MTACFSELICWHQSFGHYWSEIWSAFTDAFYDVCIQIMKVKELERFAHSAWSPLSHCHSYLATVTAEDNRQSNDLHLDAKITPSTLDIFEFNVKEKSLSMQLNVSLQTKQKGTCLLWTAPVSNLKIGLLIYGSASGSLYLYDSQKIISLHQKSPSRDQKIIDYDDDNCNIDNIYDHSGQTVEHSVFISEFDACRYLYTSRENVHNGVVRSLDFNRFQTNLFASVSNDEEIFIWDIEKMEQPMSPGAKIQPLENLCKVAWNPRVQHILCTTSIGRCVIWDLRKSGPVLQLTKTMCQLEPQIMAWSPDVATRLCIADPNNPNADVQLWDLRYPKHMLALLGCALGNAGTVNSLSWGIPECQKSMNKSYLYDTDMIVMTIGASGALPTLNGTCGTKLNPTYAEMLVVWSVDQALSSTPDTGTTHEVTPEPIYVGRLEGLDDQELASASSFNELPTNASVHWIPNHPNLICVTQSDGWITVHNLMSGLLKHSDKQIEQVNIERYVKQRALAQNSLGMHTSHKVAEAFDDEQSLISLNDSMNIRNNNNNTNNFESDSLYPVSMGDAGAACIGQQQQHQQQINSLIDQLSNDSSYYLKSPVYSLPQPMPLLRVAPCWLKRPCGAHFAFGGRLVTFSSLTILSSKRTRTLSSMSGKRSDQNRPSEIGIEQSNHQIQPQQQQHQQQSSTLSEYHQSNCGESQLHCVSIKWIDVFQLESSSIESFNSDCSKENKTMKNSIEDIIDCLANVLNCPNEYLITVCERAKELLDTTGNIDCRLSTNSQSNLTLWNVIRARLEEPASVKSSLSSLLGYSKQDYQDFSRCTSNDQLLDALKNALVTGDFISSIRICLHSNFSSLLLPDFSVLNIFAIMLTDSHRSDQPELYNEVQIKLLNMLNDLCLNNKSVNASSSSSSCLNTILMLLNGVLSRNWLNIVNNWPLTDWSTILSTFVNHLWDQDIDLLQSLCSVIVKRLLNNNEGIKNTLSSYDAGLAACICCIISGDLDGLTQYWLNLNNINENRLDDMIKICL